MDERRLKSISKVVELYGELARDELKSYMPFVLIQPIDMLCDRYDFEYWPDGWQHGTAAAKLQKQSWNTIVPAILSVPDDAILCFDFGVCSEWLTVYDVYADREITVSGARKPRVIDQEKQKKVFEHEWPWVKALWNGSEAGGMLREWLVSIPETIQIKAKYLKDVVFEV